MSPDKVEDGLKKLKNLGVIDKDINPGTGNKEFTLPDEIEEPKLFPILKDLLQENLPNKVNKDEIDEACDGLISPEKVEDGL